MNEIKEIHFYMGEFYPIGTYFTKNATHEAIKRNEKIIHTTQTHFIKTDILGIGYKIFVHFEPNDITEIKLGENERTDKEIRMEHSLEKMVHSGMFNK